LKKLFPIFFVLGFFSVSSAQTWTTVGGGISQGGSVKTLFVYDSTMYVGGFFSYPGNNIVQWNGNNWKDLSSGVNAQVNTIGMYKDTIYIGGYFTRAGGHSAVSIVKWNGKLFHGLPFTTQGGTIEALCAYDSLLFIGGTFDSVNHKHPSGLVTWNGKKTDSLHIAYGGYWGSLRILFRYKNDLLMGFGPLYASTYGQPLVAWDKKSLSYVGNNYFYTGSLNSFLYMNSFCLADTTLYLGGSFLYFENTYASHPVKDTSNNIAMWNGKKWSVLGKGIHGMVNALTYFNGLLIAGGSFDSAGGEPAHNIAAWNGISWQPLGDGLNGTVNALAIFDSNLYAGGSFMGGIAELTKQQITQLPVSATLYPNPNNGVFTIQLSSINIPLSVQIYNVLGQKIYSATSSSQNIQVNLPIAKHGVYFYTISAPGGRSINSGKFIVE